MKRNEKGFTLIELLAVIVILGLLMAIAIPSVTKYITQSRRKTLVKTIDSYITAVVNQVNDGEYKFSDSTKIFAIPIECISLEKGGTDPFGNWYQANDNYWAYVLVQYDSTNYNYKYGFTFKDDAGYGMYPTVSANIDEKGSQVKTGYDDLTKPETGYALNYLTSGYWNGFDLTSTTRLIVLESSSEGEIGDGQSTCTLCQKGDNYEASEQEKIDKWKIGREICFGEECFNIIASDNATVTMLAKEKIEITTNNPKQNASAEHIVFSTNRYWIASGGGWNLKEEYGTDFPTYIYDENSNLYQYVEAYENKIRNMGVQSVSASIISYEQYKYIIENTTTHNWLTKDYKWYMGTFGTAINIYRGDNNGCGLENYTHEAGIRPIITVNKSEVNFY